MSSTALARRVRLPHFGIGQRIGVVAVLLGAATSLEAQTTTRVSVSTGGTQATAESSGTNTSGNGRVISFVTVAPNLVAGDTNGFADVFVHDRQTGVTERVNLGPGGIEANGATQLGSDMTSLSGDGRYVAFLSSASNLVADDTNGQPDIFVRDRQTGTTTRVSVGTGGIQGNGGAGRGVISADGRFVAFTSGANNLVPNDTNVSADVFVHDRQTGETTRVNVATGGAQATGGAASLPSISPDGRFVAFGSQASDLVPGDTNNVPDIFVHDRQTGATSRVSVGTGGVQANAMCNNQSISGDGRFITFRTDATNLDPSGSTGIFIHDRQTGQTTPIAIVPEEEPTSGPSESRISGNGRYVAYTSRSASHVPNDTNGRDDLFLFDLQTSTTTLVSLTSAGVQGIGNSREVSINQDGTVITFHSGATNFVANDTNGVFDVFVRHIPGNAGPTMSLDKTSLNFGAVSNGSAFTSQTPQQPSRLTQAGAGSVSWTATPSQPWITVTPASGSGSAIFTIGVAFHASLPASGVVNGAVNLSFVGSVNSPGPIQVTLSLLAPGGTMPPQGVIDTPANNAMNVVGAVGFTGWDIDDVGILKTTLCRNAVTGEVAPVDPRCGGQAQIYVGDAVAVDGARPDVQAAFPTFPQNSTAGWGFMVLTNMLPNQGNGTYVFSTWMFDLEGNVVLLGTRTITCTNAASIDPFGTIDTPAQGAVASGSTYFNFAWALTPQPKIIPFDGSTLVVFVDGVPLGNPSYNHFRDDIATFFPGLANSGGAIGVFTLDTTTLTNGVHTIAWSVTDNLGAVTGIGSRFFSVSNGASVTEGAFVALDPLAVRALPVAQDPIDGRQGWDLDAPFDTIEMGRSGRTIVRAKALGRVELRVGEPEPGTYTGFVRVGSSLTPLPAGSHLDQATGLFTWSPGVGFSGSYDLVFVRWMGNRPVSRREIRIILDPQLRSRPGGLAR
jgi:Tol biopolymer transport system component